MKKPKMKMAKPSAKAKPAAAKVKPLPVAPRTRKIRPRRKSAAVGAQEPKPPPGFERYNLPPQTPDPPDDVPPPAPPNPQNIPPNPPAEPAANPGPAGALVRELVRELDRDFTADLPPGAAEHSLYSTTVQDRWSERTFDVPDGFYRARGSLWAFRFRGGRFIDAIGRRDFLPEDAVEV